ncbi:MAG: sensor domain-containing diguanylate cyclase [Henriciella sp.]|nr:sensor domain-containing diguanylate cyclase [Henriciella sp.]
MILNIKPFHWKAVQALSPNGRALGLLILHSLLLFSAILFLHVQSWILITFLLVFSFHGGAVLAQLRQNTDETQSVRDKGIGLADRIGFAADLYWQTDLDGRVVEAGGRLMQDMELSRDDMVGRHYLDVVKLDSNEMVKMLSALQKHSPYSDIQSIMTAQGERQYHISLSATPVFDDGGNIKGYFGVGTNVTERMRTQRKLRHLAEHDMLTGLANRYAFTKRASRDLEASGDKQSVGLLAIDLDGFKQVNDTYGHQAGDILLARVAKRIQYNIRETDWAARLGGDEFVVVSCFLDNAMDAVLIADRLTRALAKPYRISGVDLEVKASIGIACAPYDANGLDSLMKCADTALYQAKADGKGCYRMFELATPKQANSA